MYARTGILPWLAFLGLASSSGAAFAAPDENSILLTSASKRNWDAHDLLGSYPLQGVEELTRRFRSSVEEQRGKHLSEANLRELAELASRRLEGIADTNRRTKLASDIESYILRRAHKHTLTRVNPFKDRTDALEYFRTPASWELFKYELDSRLNRAVNRQEPKALTPAVESQIDRILLATRVRLSGVFAGPDADAYLKGFLERSKRILTKDADSELEFAFEKPLSEELLRELEHTIATFQPSEYESLDPDAKKRENSGQILIEDAENPPTQAIFYTDMGLGGRVKSFVHGHARPPNFYDEKYQLLAAKAAEEFETLGEILNSSEPIDLEKLVVNSRIGSPANEPSKVSSTLTNPSERASNPEGVPSAPSGKPRADERAEGPSWLLTAIVVVVVASVMAVLATLYRRLSTKTSSGR